MPPLFIREYIVIAGLIIIATFAFYAFFKKRNLLKWGQLILLVLSSAYFSGNVFVTIGFLLVLLHFFMPKKSMAIKVGYYFLLLPLIPLGFSQSIPFPGLEKLFVISYSRALTLFILLPLFLSFVLHPKKGLFSLPFDKYVILYFAYIFIIGFRDTTFTDAFRGGFNLFIDFFIPYFVVSRVMTSAEDAETIFRPMMLIAFILALMAIFETLKGWHMYVSLRDISQGFTTIGYGRRLGMLRASGSFLSPIIFGVYFSIMISFLIFLRYCAPHKKMIYFNLTAAIFFTAILCTISRGPLVSIVVFFFVFILLERKRSLRLVPIALAIIFALFLSPLSNITLSTLPFIGEKQQRTIQYRQRLWTNSLKVIKRSPLTGSNTFMEEPEIQELRKHGGAMRKGRVDIVNSFLMIILNHGIIGVTLFALILIHSLYNLLKASFIARDEKETILCKTLFSIIMAMVATLATVSTVSFLAHYLWALFGLTAGCIHMVMGRHKGRNKKYCATHN
jgi:O-antigen ligase